MSKIIKQNENDAGVIKAITTPMQRRIFFKYAGAGAALSTLLLVSCDDDDDNGGSGSTNSGVDLGSADVGVLNYAYALEQLEAAFYTMVVGHSAFNTTFSNALERSVLTDIRDHEVAHREFLKAAIPANSRIKDLTPDFSSINLSDRTAVLNAAKTFEDLGVAAYNGAGKLFTNSGAGLTYLTLAGKIVSVEARHAAEIRDLISNGSFADNTVIDNMGFDKALMPNEVLTAAKPFIKDTINFSNLPTQ
ncbi:ferritin-like domain-containing protein [Adhaeribacter aquaticus]|uniref:ferritin-like domain-containing protein n=1 Tax=Adhaeribacter aquaticus TaxID=299567 RepID=UPI000556A279|nr:ferritin-like domain-containing protein [Adhaeribacter aquaticus]